MTKYLLLCFALCVPAVAADLKSSDFPVAIHLTASHSEKEVSGSVPIRNTYTNEVYGNVAVENNYLYVAATVDGRNYELKSVRPARHRVLDPGDYQARFSEHKNRRFYEILLPSGKSVKFEVIGAS
jgi:hypothetical protein